MLRDTPIEVDCPLNEILTWVSWLEYAPGYNSLPKSPDYVLGPFSHQLFNLYQSAHWLLPIGCFCLKHVGVTSDGVVFKDNDLVAIRSIGHTASQYQRGVVEEVIQERRHYRATPVRRAVLLLDVGYPIYGHWLVDIIPKLFVLDRMGYWLDELTYLVPDDTPAFGLRWLELVGIRPDQLLRYDPRREIVAVDELIVPTPLRAGDRSSIHHPAAATFIWSLIDRTRKDVEPSRPTPKRIMISRAQTGNSRQLTNRDEIERIAVEHGIELVYPEKLSLLQQVEMFRGAEVVIGEYGSAMHGSIYSRPGTRFCVLRAATGHPGFLQSGLCDVFRQECGYVMGEAPFGDIYSEYRIEPDHFRAALALLNTPAHLTVEARSLAAE